MRSVAAADDELMMAKCWKCKEPMVLGSYLDRYFCSRCGSIVPLPAGTNHFEVFGFDAPACDLEQLRERHRELSRRLHPDFFMTADEQVRSASTINISAVNDAYRCLSDPMARAAYWLDISGSPLGKDNSSVDPELAAELFELQELAMQMRAAGESPSGRVAGGAGDSGGNSIRAAEALDDLQSRFDAEITAAVALMDSWPQAAAERPGALYRLKKAISRASYMRTMIRNLKDSLEQRWQRSVA